MIKLHFLSVGFKKKVLIQPGEDIIIYPGLYCLAGANGSGKTSLLKTISGLNKSLSGEVVIDEKNISEYSSYQIAQKIGFLFSLRPFAPYMTALQMVLTGFYPFLSAYKSPEDNEIQKALKMLELLDSLNLKDEQFSNLSDGQKQKVMLARTLAPEFQTVLLDEPMNFLDIPSKRLVLEVLFEYSSKPDRTVLFTQHELFEKMNSVKNWLFIDKNQKLVSLNEANMTHAKFEEMMF